MYKVIYHKFLHARWHHEDRKIIVFIGDKVKFQNGYLSVVQYHL